MGGPAWHQKAAQASPPSSRGRSKKAKGSPKAWSEEQVQAEVAKALAAVGGGGPWVHTFCHLQHQSWKIKKWLMICFLN